MLNDEEFRLALAKFRGVETRPLQFQPSVGCLIDINHCIEISKILHNVGARWERNIATPTLGSSLPTEKGIYMFVWCPSLTLEFETSPHTFRPSWVLYVGKAGVEGGTHDTIQHRYQSEYCKYVGSDPSCLWDEPAVDDRETRLARYLSVRPLEHWFLPLKNTKEISSIERTLIRMFNPPVNRQHGRKLRATTTEPA
jgi:hypothetical protein